MFMPTVTLHAASLLGILFVVLSALVVAGRTTSKVMIGSGEGSAEAQLLVAVRCHANFAEYVPLALLLIGLLELQTGHTLLVKILAGTLVVARVLHPVGMRMKAPNPLRAGGFLLTVIVLAVASIKGLLLIMF
jgi:uncharacterized membrane protein YecN with MAPEG domain